ncbi:MAG: DUF4369 domain-containing protein [Muribaculaceae bacterium]|nr:DUF4369 domain-containing protein [Muribaculaceae bacterium]
MFLHLFTHHKSSLLAVIISAIIMSACGNSDSFTISGEIEGLGTRNLRFYYNDGNAVKVGLASAIDSKFRFEGHSKVPTVVTITTGQRSVLATVVAENGNDITLTLYANDPYKMKAKGNKTTEQFAEFININTETLSEGNSQKINQVVANYVKQFPKRQSATLAMLTYYDMRIAPAEADSLLSLIDPKARPTHFVAGYRDLLSRAEVGDSTIVLEPITLYCEKDSLTTIDPRKNKKTLFSFITGVRAMDDSIKIKLKEFVNDKNIKIVNVYLDTDTTQWKNHLRHSLPPGLNTWTTGALASPRLSQFKLRNIPAFVVVDSTSTIIYKGLSLTEAVEKIK